MRREALDEALLLGEHRLLARVRGLAVRLADGALALVEVIVAGVGRDLPAVDLGDLRHDAVHELAVVRRHQQRAVERLQEALEPDDRLDVQMVRRLVHQQDVRAPEQHARHCDAHLPAARERADVAVDPFVVEAEPVEHLAGLRLERVAAQMVVLLLHLAEAREDAIEIGGLRRIGQVVLQPLELVVQIADAAAAENRFVEDRAARHLFDVLPEISDRRALRHRHVAFVGRLLADDHPEQRRLPGAVRADEADLLPGIQLEGGVDEEHLAPVLLADVGERDHRWIDCTCGTAFRPVCTYSIFTRSSAPNSIVRSLSRAAHFSSVAMLGCTFASKTVFPFAVTLIVCDKSNASGETSSVNSATPREAASTVLPVRVRSTRPDR